MHGVARRCRPGLARLMVRDVVFGGEWTRSAASAVNAPVEDLIRFADTRAKDGPVKGLPGRDLIREGLEELADARNYVVWEAQRQYEGHKPDSGVIEHLGTALGYVAAAFAELRAARGLTL